MSGEDRCANCGAVIEYEAHFNPARGGERFCGAACASAAKGEPDDLERAATEGGKKWRRGAVLRLREARREDTRARDRFRIDVA